MFLFIALLFTLGVKCIHSARILCVFQMAAISHHNVFQPVWRELSLRGHQVVAVTPIPLKDRSLVNLTEIDVGPSNFAIMERHGFQFYMNKEYGVHTKIPKIFDMNNEFAEAMLNNKEFIKVYNNTAEKFDLVIAQTYVIPTLYSLAAKFGVPLIGISSMGGYIGTHYALGNPNPPSLYSEMFLSYHGDMTFSERFRSTLYFLWSRYFLTFEGYPKSDQIARKYLGKNLPYIADIERNMSLLFLTTNPFMYMPRPTVPTIISLEHIHIKPPRPLPKDLKELLDSSKEGIIYFSLGSNVKSINTTRKVRDTLIEAFAELPYKILWKFEEDSLPMQPKNVITKKWLPQQDILGHPNIKVFFSQCGLQSTEEAVAREVPIVAMPFIADQEMNAKRLVELGVAVSLDFVTTTKEDIKKAVIEVAENDKYRRNMAKLNALWTDQPMKALDRAIWWIEYVIRHNGTKHLRSPTADVAWFEYLLVDVILVLVLVSSVIIVLVYKTLQFVLLKLLNSKKEKQS